jgi:hypothetical protein
MFKQFTIQGHQKWFKLLPEIMDKYNNKIHSSIKETPANVSKNPELIEDVTRYNNNYNEYHLDKKKPKFKMGQRVRIFKYKKMFEKGFTGYWTDEVFVINEILPSTPITYKIKALDGEEIIGTFYTSELQASDF